MKHLLTLCFIILTLASFGQISFVKDSIGGAKNLTGNDAINYKKPRKYTIGGIRVEGADNFDHQAVKLIAGIRQGEDINIPGEKISKAIKNLWDEGLFSSVSIEMEKEVAGVAYLVIKLQPRPKLSRVRYTGINRRDVDKVREEVNLNSGKTITENLVFTTQNKIRNYFKDKGFNNVTVNIIRTQDTLINNSEIFTIAISKGQKVRIKEIILDGPVSVKQWKLKAAMKDTKQKRWWRVFKRSKFNQTAYGRDKEAMLDKLRATGLRDVSMTVDSVYNIDERNMGIYIKIDEGSKYYFGNITWIGNTKFSNGILDTIFGIKYGDVYNKPLFDQRIYQSQDGRDISSLYMDRGYLFFNITPVETGVDDYHINYEMRIVEGKEARVKNIIIKGNTKTNEHVIRREIRTKPGDLFNRNDIIRTQRELSQLGYFNDQAFQINPIPNPQDGTVDIEYIVEEKSADQIELSGGYGAGRVIGTLGLTFSNFSVRNFFKKDAWSPLPTGDGQRLSIRAQTNGRYYQGYSFSFTEPWMGGKKPNSFTFGINNTSFSSQTSTTTIKKSDPGYKGVSITGMSVGLGRRKKIPDDYFSAYYEMAYQYYDVRNYASYFPNFSNGYSNDVSLKYVLQRNSINVPIFPVEGSRLTFSAKTSVPYSAFNNKDFSTATQQEKYRYLEYFKMKFTGEYYFPLTSGTHKLVLSPRFGFGFMGGYNKSKGITPFERFSLGGSGLSGINSLGGREIIALRGYDDSGGPEISSSGGDPIIAKYTMELRYPISLNPQATVFILAFAEAGNTYTSFKSFNPFNVKRSVGGGLRVYLPMFGMLGLDYGWGFDQLDPHSAGYRQGYDLQRIQKGYAGKFTFTIGMNLGEL